jgi:formylglycine-generating enzyme
MTSANKEKIINNVTILANKYRVLSEICDIHHGTAYFGESVSDSKVFVLRIFYDYRLESEQAYVELEDEFFQYLEHAPDHVQKPIEVLRINLDGFEHKFPVLVLERLEGTTALSVMKKDEDQCIEFNRAMLLVAELCENLEPLGSRGYFHGNLNPGCLIITSDFKVRLFNFPYFRFENSPFDGESLQRYYAAPELFKGEEKCLKSEVYAIGCLLHELFVGEPPFESDDQKQAHLEESCPGLNGIPAKINKLILSCLEKQPGKRPTSFQVIAETLRKGSKIGAGIGIIAKVAIGVLGLLLFSGGYYGYNAHLEGKRKKTATLALKKKQDREILAKKEAVIKEKAKERAELEKKALEERKLRLLAQKRKEEERKNYRPPDLPGMVYFSKTIFTMGDIRCYEDCNIVHRVSLAPFYLDIAEVSNTEYYKFVQAENHPPPKNKRNKYNLWKGGEISDEIKGQPVINVSWKSAQEYCIWAKKRLPTEAEWEYGARGIEARMYPWGEDDPSPVLAQFDGEWSGAETLYEVHFFEPGKTPQGLYNMLGGVKEWVQDWYAPDYYKDSPSENPQGPKVGEKRSVRGGSWEEVPEISSVRDNLNPKSQLEDLGFRCAKTVVIPGDEKTNEVKD